MSVKIKKKLLKEIPPTNNFPEWIKNDLENFLEKKILYRLQIKFVKNLSLMLI